MSNDIVVDDNELIGDVVPDEPTEVAATTEDTFSMPEKFTGKSAEEIAQSYIELEKTAGRSANEIGELRKLTDQYIHQELTRGTKSDPVKESEPSLEFDDFIEDPGTAINSAVDRRLKEVNERFDKQDAQRSAEKFAADNPDYQEISASQEFYSWANATPYRVRQLQAAQAGDYDAAGDILQGYRDHNQSASDLTEAAKVGEEVKREKALKDASTETAGTGATSGKVYKKSELRKMYMYDQAEYERQLPEIEKAYREGRVK